MGMKPLETRKKRQLMLNVALILSQGIPFYSLWSRSSIVVNDGTWKYV